MSRSLLHSDYVSASNYGMKNRIINGGMDIAQRGTSFTAASGYTLDRWYSDNITDGAVTVTQNADIPSTNEFQNSLRVTVTTADTSIAASQYNSVGQVIEGYNIRDLIGRTFTVSFWVRSTKTGIHCLSMQNTSADRCYIAEYSIAVSNTWEYKTITVTGGLPTAGTWNYTNGLGLYVRFHLATGSTWQGSTGWNTTIKFGTSNQVNCLDTIGNIFAITGVQLEVGAIATQFEHRLYGQELMLCQRYYCVIPPQGIAYNTVSISQTIQQPVTMRANASCALIGSLRKTSDGQVCAPTTPVVATVGSGSGIFYIFAVYASSWSNALVVGQAYDGAGGAYITCNAEF